MKKKQLPWNKNGQIKIIEKFLEKLDEETEIKLERTRKFCYTLKKSNTTDGNRQPTEQVRRVPGGIEWGYILASFFFVIHL